MFAVSLNSVKQGIEICYGVNGGVEDLHLLVASLETSHEVNHL